METLETKLQGMCNQSMLVSSLQLTLHDEVFCGSGLHLHNHVVLIYMKIVSCRYDPLFARDGSTVDCPVPWEQQPVNEYQMLNETGLFAWATDDILSFTIRLSAVIAGISALVGYPVASLSINAQQEFLKCVLGASCGGVIAATVVTLRLYLGWAYIGNRLLSATVECALLPSFYCLSLSSYCYFVHILRNQ